MSGQVNYERIANEFYPTPTGFVRCLASHFSLHDTNWWEPACGEGHIAFEVVKLTGVAVRCSDIIRYPKFGDKVHLVEEVDFLSLREAPRGVTGIITNPPYLTINVVDEPEEGEDDWRYLAPLARSYGIRSKRVSLAELFLRHAIELMRPVQGKVAMFLRNEFDCGSKRMNLFQHSTYQMKIICTERPRWIEGSTGSPRHNYSWYCFDWRNESDPVVRYAHPKTAKPITFQ